MGFISNYNTFRAKIFLLGMIIAIFIGVLILLLTLRVIAPNISINQLHEYNSIIYLFLIILGILMGFAMSFGENSNKILIILAIVVIISSFIVNISKGSLVGIGSGEVVRIVFGTISFLFIPATIIVAVKNIFNISKIGSLKRENFK